jgi:hypothetical protein
MNIRTFASVDPELNVAINEAEGEAQGLLGRLNPDELVGVQAQTVISQVEDGTFGRTRYYHIITVTYE